MGSQRETGFLHVIAQKTGEEGRRGRMNFTERAHVFSTPNVTFWKRPEDFLATDYSKNSLKVL